MQKKNAKKKKEKKEVAVSPLSCDHSTLCVKAIERLIAGGGGVKVMDATLKCIILQSFRLLRHFPHGNFPLCKGAAVGKWLLLLRADLSAESDLAFKQLKV